MNILILGSGGREHALAWKISQSPQCERLYVAPGNAGTAQIAENTELDAGNFGEVEKWVKSNKIDLVIPGPEDPIVSGIYDHFKEKGLLKKHAVLAPDKNSARLEGSKVEAKKFMHRHKIPTGAYAAFNKNEIEKAREFVRQHDLPMVIKADGLAAGKGVVICHEQHEAEEALTGILEDGQFGKAGQKVVIEEFLQGNEVSVFALTDGKNLMMLPNACDYKKAGENDTGPNTGGMGAFSPAGANEEFLKKVDEQVVRPTLRGIEMESGHYHGFLFFGLINVNGNPFVLEYNVRLGDPETQVILPRIDEDILPHFLNAANGELENRPARQSADIAATVILASGGYPGKYEKGKIISGLEEVDESLIFHAGTKLDQEEVVTSGGRVLALTSLAPDLEQAVSKSYNSIHKIHFEGKYYRGDIGKNVTIPS